MKAMPYAIKNDPYDRVFYVFMEGESFWIGFVRQKVNGSGKKHLTGYINVPRADWNRANFAEQLAREHRVTFEAVGSIGYNLPREIKESFAYSDHDFWIGIDFMGAEVQPTPDAIALLLELLLKDIYA